MVTSDIAFHRIPPFDLVALSHYIAIPPNIPQDVKKLAKKRRVDSIFRLLRRLHPKGNASSLREPQAPYRIAQGQRQPDLVTRVELHGA